MDIVVSATEGEKSDRCQSPHVGRSDPLFVF